MRSDMQAVNESGEVKEQSRALSSTVYDLIYQRIANGQLQAGDAIVEATIAQESGFSRTPIREAIKLLQAEGLLELSGGRSLTVTRLSFEKTAQLFYMREVVEGLAARLAANNANNSDIEFMAKLLEEEAATPVSEIAKLFDINDKFHATIHRISGNEYAIQFMQNYKSMMMLHRSMTRGKFVPSGKMAHEHHRVIFKAIENEDPIAAEKAMRDHIRFSRRKRLELLYEIEETNRI